MKRKDFIECAESLRNYADWERKMYGCGIDMCNTPVSMLAEKLQETMCDFDEDWSYDEKLKFDWIVEWSFSQGSHFFHTRHGVEFDLNDAGALYDFLVFMNEHGWED